MLPPSGAERLRKMILPHMPRGRAPLGSGLGAKPPYSGVTIAILGDYRVIQDRRRSLCIVLVGTYCIYGSMLMLYVEYAGAIRAIHAVLTMATCTCTY